MAPSKDEIKVAISALRSQAGDWRAQEAPLKDAASLALGMQLSGLEMGVFFPLQGPYTDLINQISGRCTEGATEMVSIADTLAAVAGVYETEEAQNVHRLRGLY